MREVPFDKSLKLTVPGPEEATNVGGFDSLTLREQVEVALGRLLPQQRQILELRFGLIDGNMLSRAEAAAVMEISEAEAERLESVSMRILNSFRLDISSLT